MNNGFVRLKKNVSIEELKSFGFEPDPVNCELGDTYYHLNNYYVPIGDSFRVTISIHGGQVDILCLSQTGQLENMYDLKLLYDMFSSDMFEYFEK